MKPATGDVDMMQLKQCLNNNNNNKNNRKQEPRRGSGGMKALQEALISRPLSEIHLEFLISSESSDPPARG